MTCAPIYFKILHHLLPEFAILQLSVISALWSLAVAPLTCSTSIYLKILFEYHFRIDDYFK